MCPGKFILAERGNIASADGFTWHVRARRGSWSKPTRIWIQARLRSLLILKACRVSTSFGVSAKNRTSCSSLSSSSCLGLPFQVSCCALTLDHGSSKDNPCAVFSATCAPQ